jgi:predicted nucleic acid-binding protein
MEDKKLNIIYDTNVIVSSLLSTHRDSATVKALDYFYDKKVNLIYSDEIMTEYLDVLNRDKFGFDKNKIKELISIIKKKGIGLIQIKLVIMNLILKINHFTN